MADETTATAKSAITPINDIGEVKPVFTNYLQVWIQAGLVRLTYGEVTSQKNLRFHTALVMPASDAQIFANLVLKLIADNPDKLSTLPVKQAP